MLYEFKAPSLNHISTGLGLLAEFLSIIKKSSHNKSLSTVPLLTAKDLYMAETSYSLFYKTSTEKFEPKPGFEPRTSGFLARHTTT